jgi:hypothetical protein
MILIRAKSSCNLLYKSFSGNIESQGLEAMCIGCARTHSYTLRVPEPLVTWLMDPACIVPRAVRIVVARRNSPNYVT